MLLSLIYISRDRRFSSQSSFTESLNPFLDAFLRRQRLDSKQLLLAEGDRWVDSLFLRSGTRSKSCSSTLLHSIRHLSGGMRLV